MLIIQTTVICTNGQTLTNIHNTRKFIDTFSPNSDEPHSSYNSAIYFKCLIYKWGWLNITDVSQPHCTRILNPSLRATDWLCWLRLNLPFLDLSGWCLLSTTFSFHIRNTNKKFTWRVHKEILTFSYLFTASKLTWNKLNKDISIIRYNDL